MNSRRDERNDTLSSEPEERGGFLGRWSRLKQEAARGRPDVDASTDPAVTGHEEVASDLQSEAASDVSEEGARIAEENQAIAESIDLESLDFSSDYSAFLKQGVSRELKRQALRRLWTSDPVLACVDGLNDYDEDFRKVEVLKEGFRSSWQVGRGFGWMDEKPDDAAEIAEVVPETDSVSQTDATGDAAAPPLDGDAIDLPDDAREGDSGDLVTVPDETPSTPVASGTLSGQAEAGTVLAGRREAEPGMRQPREPAPAPSRRRMRFE